MEFVNFVRMTSHINEMEHNPFMFETTNQIGYHYESPMVSKSPLITINQCLGKEFLQSHLGLPGRWFQAPQS